MLLLLWIIIWTLTQSRQAFIFYKTTFSSDMIFTKDDASTSYEKVEKLTREFNIQYKACIGSFIYSLPIIVDLSFEVNKS